MSSRLVYIDQNIISYQANGKINFVGLDGAQWVYSKEHFSEIRRSTRPETYLDALDALGAQLLEIELSEWKFSGKANHIAHGSAREHYARYIEAVDEVPVDVSALGALTAWANGGGSAELLQEVPNILDEQIRSLLSYLPPELMPQDWQEASVEFRSVIEKMVAQGNDIERSREALGVGKGAAGGVSGDNQIRQIWEMISPNVPNQTIDQFFGFEPYAQLGQEPWTTYEGIIRCCAMLDFVGFQADKKSRKPEKIENIMSDAAHIAAAAYCEVIISADKRLACRAKAIYQYKGVGTASLILSVAG